MFGCKGKKQEQSKVCSKPAPATRPEQKNKKFEKIEREKKKRRTEKRKTKRKKREEKERKKKKFSILLIVVFLQLFSSCQLAKCLFIRKEKKGHCYSVSNIIVLQLWLFCFDNILGIIEQHHHSEKLKA